MKKLHAVISWILIGIMILPMVLVNSQEVVAAGGMCDKGSTAGGKYHDMVCSCIKDRAAGKARSNDSVLCPQGANLSDQQVAYQVILDAEFRKIDDAVYKDLQQFQTRREKDVVAMNNQGIVWFSQGITPEGTYTKKYNDICRNFQNPDNPINKAVMSFSTGAITTDIYNKNTCDTLVYRKLEAFSDMAYLIALRNVQKSYDNDRKVYFRGLRSLYTKFLAKWDSYVVGLARIKDKWVQKTRQVY